MTTFTLDLVTPEKLVFSKEVTQVDIPGADGRFGVLAKHAPLISTLEPGVVSIFGGKEGNESVFVSGGFAEVTADRCTILADEAANISELTKEASEQRLRDAEKTIAKPTATPEEKARAQKDAVIASAQLKALSS